MQYIEAKSILSKLRTNDSYFGITYNMNLYRGCQHACIYCDTRSECYGINDISKISVKSNALELLTKELRSKRKAKAIFGEQYICNSPNYKILMDTFYNLSAKLNIATRIRFYQPVKKQQFNIWG